MYSPRKEKKKSTESSRNPIFAKLLHGEIISLFFPWFFFFVWEKTEGKINKFLQLNKHSERYSSRQRADNPHLKGTNKLCNTAMARQPGKSRDLYFSVFFSVIYQALSLLWGWGSSSNSTCGRWGGCGWKETGPEQQSGNPEHQIKETEGGRTHPQLQFISFFSESCWVSLPARSMPASGLHLQLLPSSDEPSSPVS